MVKDTTAAVKVGEGCFTLLCYSCLILFVLCDNSIKKTSGNFGLGFLVNSWCVFISMYLCLLKKRWDCILEKAMRGRRDGIIVTKRRVGSRREQEEESSSFPFSWVMYNIIYP